MRVSVCLCTRASPQPRCPTLVESLELGVGDAQAAGEQGQELAVLLGGGGVVATSSISVRIGIRIGTSTSTGTSTPEGSAASPLHITTTVDTAAAATATAAATTTDPIGAAAIAVVKAVPRLCVLVLQHAACCVVSGKGSVKVLQLIQRLPQLIVSSPRHVLHVHVLVLTGVVVPAEQRLSLLRLPRMLPPRLSQCQGRLDVRPAVLPRLFEQLLVDRGLAQGQVLVAQGEVLQAAHVLDAVAHRLAHLGVFLVVVDCIAVAAALSEGEADEAVALGYPRLAVQLLRIEELFLVVVDRAI